MRKSAAPSQAGSYKPRFIAPLKQHNPDVSCEKEEIKTNISQNLVLKRLFSDRCGQPVISDENKATDPVSLSNHEKQPEKAEAILLPQQKKPRFETPLLKKPNPELQLQSTSSVKDQSISEKKDEVQIGYFSVVWCKRSSKKHKKWEGDAVLVTKGRSVTLYDTEGKEIGRGSGYKSTELASLKEDETLPIGGKEIQVMSILTEDQFKSGKCFSGCTMEVNPAPAKAPRLVSKPFVKPQKTGAASGHIALNTGTAVPETVQQAKPRHDPEAENALVLPRPSQTHQWMWNKKNLPVVDVVVDPYLSYHLRPHQREGVTFLYECVMGYKNFGGFGAILADDMGLGKTLQCICLIWTLLKQGPYGGIQMVKKVLIVTPGSLVKNWFQEFKKWLGTERLKVYAVSSDKKVEDFMNSSVYPILVISYEMFVRAYETIKHAKFDLIVCDEGHRLKNTTIKTTSLIMSLPTERRVVLTGTPIQNDLQEFYSIVEFCNPGVLGTSASFRRVYEEPIVAARQPGSKQEDISLGEERGAELSRMTQMFVLRRTQEINNKYLPPKSEIVVFCKPTRLQLALYQQLLRCQLIKSCLLGRMSGAPHLICIAALKKVCNHPMLVYQKTANHGAEAMEADNKWNTNSLYVGLQSHFPEDYTESTELEEQSGKLSVLGQLLQQIRESSVKEKIVVVSNHTKTLDVIQCLCDNRNYGYLRLDGQTPTARRQELVQKFNSSYCQEFIFLLSSKAGGVGLNLIGASRLVLYDIDWNPANDLQAMARVWRDGQKRRVHIYRFLTTGSIEEKIFQRQISKQGLSGAVMDVREKNDVQFSLDDLKKSKNIGMDELMDWKHYPGSIIRQHQDWCLERAMDDISFVFYSDIESGS